MNNEKKTLGQILLESGDAGLSWCRLRDGQKALWERRASAVEQAVLERLPGEWVLLKMGDRTIEGDEKFFGGYGIGWQKLAQPGWVVNKDVVRRRIHRAMDATENGKTWNKFIREELEMIASNYAEQITTLTKERDEARSRCDELVQSVSHVKSRAEQAEKKLSEVESELRVEHGHRIAAESVMKDLEQKLQQAEASVPRWIPTSERMPTKEDADESGCVWILERDADNISHPIREIFHSNVQAGRRSYSFWMTPIHLPTPTEEKEDAFMRWANTSGASTRSTLTELEAMRVAFKAGQALSKG